MLGEVWEWMADYWHGNYNGAPTDGSAWTTGGSVYRVIRGGSWSGYAHEVRAASRLYYVRSYRIDPPGFRCVRVQQ
jgi:formylglycine-generating enzyme required for sulfatase activity